MTVEEKFFLYRADIFGILARFKISFKFSTFGNVFFNFFILFLLDAREFQFL